MNSFYRQLLIFTVVFQRNDGWWKKYATMNSFKSIYIGVEFALNYFKKVLA